MVKSFTQSEQERSGIDPFCQIYRMLVKKWSLQLISTDPIETSSINSSSTNSATNTTATGELFICFTSRLSSSSSMKLPSSKSILSPARSRDNPQPPAQISLSSSLSRRLRSNGSLKGQASPMFPSGGGKKRGGAGFDNPEPSSPKVTCIGQVRVKTKKQGKKLRSRSKRNGEASFRKLELSRSGHHSFPPQNGNRNQRWVHFPETICEALRTFGSDWNCFFPCRSSCMSSNKEEKAVAVSGPSGSGGNGDGSSSCGAVIARWLVAVHEGEGGRGGRREIELVVGGEEIPTNERSGSQRRHIFEGLEFDEEEIRRERKEAEEEEEKGRVSICIPPKNALLLMRCRSDPLKMAALANRFCESPVRKVEEDTGKAKEDVQKDNSEGIEKVVEEVVVEKEIEQLKEEVSEEYLAVNAEASDEQTTEEAESSSVVGEEDEEGLEVDQELIVMLPEESVDIEEEKEEEDRTEVLSNSGDESPSVHDDEEISEEEEEAEATKAELLAENDNAGIGFDNELTCTMPESESDVEEVDEKDTETINAGEAVSPELEGRTEEAATADERSEPENPEPDGSDPVVESKGRDSVDRKPAGLPDCLLLMMCEPKLSMEVSKETWVCSTDFIRWLPERHHNKAAPGGDGPKKKAAATAALNTKRTDSALTAQQARILQQPPRSSCSFPSQAAAMAAGAARRSNAGESNMAAMIEQKLLSAKAGEPLALTRCKSEPMRNAMKFAPDACFWKNRKLEPHRQSGNLRVKTAGVGF